ncbi:uncharacterized protein LOC119402068 [Rhipicephalus sanguineus]|uniref:uncharacterized protein LOC119402068 n=1 Tax=Rhipicephalus sanguineus TaxID=34632 RepID=UPI0020C3D3DF|nr:uncharacterized protein LOC119402068 [Rhipicephalus sanguineus]
MAQNSQQYPSAQMTISNPQPGQQLSWRIGAPAGVQQLSTVAQQANRAVQMLPNPSTLPNPGMLPNPSGEVVRVGSQGLQQGQAYSWRGGISPGGHQNTAAQHVEGASLPIPNHPTQPSLNGQPPSQPWNTRVTSSSSEPNDQQQQNTGLPSQFPTSFPTPKPIAVTKQSIHHRVVTIQQQTVQRSLRRQSVSTSSRR